MNKIKMLMVTGSSEDPRLHDDWWSSWNLSLEKDYSVSELISISGCESHEALWVFKGEDFEDHNNILGENIKFVNGLVRKGMLFYPWDRMECLELVREAEQIHEEHEEDDWMEQWRKEIAMEAGMSMGISAYNDYMGFNYED